MLAGLSILGVLAGILLRVRAFLYLGTAFLVVALMTIIWHAAERHTWIWWLTGIVTGALIIALFGLFEKRRDDVLRVVEELKHSNDKAHLIATIRTIHPPSPPAPRNCLSRLGSDQL